MKLQSLVVAVAGLALVLATGACSDKSGPGTSKTDASTGANPEVKTDASAPANGAAAQKPGPQNGATQKNAAQNNTAATEGSQAHTAPALGHGDEDGPGADAAAAMSHEPKTGGPAIAFFELDHQFGQVYEGADVRHTFKFENVGDQPLVISRVKTSCGCTVAQKPEDPIAPGTSNQIEVAFNSKGRTGHNSKDISVFSNDPDKPMVKLHFDVDVIKQFWVEPQKIYLGNLTKSQQVEEKKLQVHWADDVELEVTKIQPSDAKMKVSQTPLPEGHGLELTVQFPTASELLTDSAGPMQRINQYIDIETSRPEFNTRVTVSGALIPEVTIRPRVLSFGVIGRDSKPVTKKIIVTSAQDFELQPPTVDSSLPYLKFEVKPIQANKQYQIEATLDPASAPEGQFRETVDVKTNSKEFADNNIPLFGKIKE